MNKNFTSVVYSISVFLMFGFWMWVEKTPLSGVWKLIIIVVGAETIYNLIYYVAFYIVEHIEIIKKHIFGNCYLAGTWVGFYRTYEQDGTEQYKLFYEIFNQNIDGTKIRGTSYYDRKSISTKWVSHDVNILTESK